MNRIKFNKDVYVHIKELSSTNDKADELLRQNHQPCVVQADIQTNGRGRLGKVWQSLKGNLFVSFGVEIKPQATAHLAVIAGLAGCDAVQHFLPNAKAEIKWPNDVLVQEKKIAGILIEHSFDDFWVFGFGINIENFPENINQRYECTALNIFAKNVSEDEVLEKLVENFEKYLNIYQKEGYEPLKKSYLDKAFRYGKRVQIKVNERMVEGVFSALTEDGRIILKSGDNLQSVIAGEMLIKKE